LIKKKKNEWFAEDEQDLHEWCLNNNYTLIPEDGNEKKLLEPYFEVEIRDKKTEYHIGGTVELRYHFRGKVEHGYVSTRVTHSEGKAFCYGTPRWLYALLHKRKTRGWVWDDRTLPYNYGVKFLPSLFRKGKLNGYVDIESGYCVDIGYELLQGKYLLSTGIYDGVRNHVFSVVAPRDEIVTVVA
jgi:hypothetical protein